MNTRNQILTLLTGTTFAIAGTTFVMSSDGTPFPAVAIDGAYYNLDDAVEIDGVWHLKDDCVETHDGTYALNDDCSMVYSCWNQPSSRYAEYEWYSAEQLELAKENGDIEFVSMRNAYYTADYVVWSEDSGEYLHREDAEEIDGEYYDRDSDSICCDGHGTYFLAGDGDWVACEDGYWPAEECHECGSEWVHGEESECEDCGRCGNRINAYHSSPSPYLNRGSSGWLVGFEVEKATVDGCDEEHDVIEELPLFSGWELDGSCGVEGITHAYDPIDERTRDLFLRDLRVSRAYVDEPTNDRCGGHINLSHSGHTNEQLFEKFRKYAGIYYALYKGRLNNEYCCLNKSLLYSSDKYVTVKRKPFGIELRLVSKVPNAEVLSRRFDLIAATCQSIDNNVSFSEALRLHKPVLLDAYSNNRIRVAQIMRLARHFHKWLHTNESHPSIERYIS